MPEESGEQQDEEEYEGEYGDEEEEEEQLDEEDLMDVITQDAQFVYGLLLGSRSKYG